MARASGRVDTEHGSGTIDPAEIAKFAAMAGDWWDPDGAYRPLHRQNAARLGFIRDGLCRHFGRDPLSLSSLAGLAVADVGCGGGLVAEPLARLGAAVVGVDATEANIAAARHHADGQGLAIDYRCTTAEALAEAGARFDAVVALEIVEHVADVAAFLAACAALVGPGGVVVLSTMNRTARAFAMAIVGAEYVLRWLPRGTHDWRRFVKPSELARQLRASGLALTDLTGLVLDPLQGGWRLDPRDVAVNYMALAVKPA
ncbi:MAG: bifunctional 2-polyprenyl-6-hydroxyphenol methylase/3-demethylubiquinol 3-O-methyltransferase UbiG [Alphaproteobacteria bacterium]